MPTAAATTKRAMMAMTMGRAKEASGEMVGQGCGSDEWAVVAWAAGVVAAVSVARHVPAKLRSIVAANNSLMSGGLLTTFTSAGHFETWDLLLNFVAIEGLGCPVGFLEFVGVEAAGDGQDGETLCADVLDDGRGIFNDEALFGLDDFLEFFGERLEREEIALGVGLAGGDVFGGYDDGEAVAEGDAFEHHLDFVAEGAGADGQGVIAPEGSDELLDAGEGLVFAAVDLAEHGLFFPGHDAEEGFWVEGAAVFFEDAFEGAAVVEADELVVVVLFGEVDFLGLEDFLEGEEVEGFGVNEDAVEIKEDCSWPEAHERQTLSPEGCICNIWGVYHAHFRPVSFS